MGARDPRGVPLLLLGACRFSGGNRDERLQLQKALLADARTFSSSIFLSPRFSAVLEISFADDGDTRQRLELLDAFASIQVHGATAWLSGAGGPLLPVAAVHATNPKAKEPPSQWRS